MADRANGEQIILQLFRPPVLPYRLTQLCGMITEQDNRFTGLKAPDTFNVTFYVYSADPTVDTRYALPRPDKEIAHSSLCQVNKSSPRWWYPTVDWDCLQCFPLLHFCVCACLTWNCVCLCLFSLCGPRDNSGHLERDDFCGSWVEPV